MDELRKQLREITERVDELSNIKNNPYLGQDSISEIDRAITPIRESMERLERRGLATIPDLTAQTLIKSIVFYPIRVSLTNTLPQTAGNFSTFFVAERSYFVVAVTEVHGTLGDGAGSVTLQLERLQGTEALDAGDELLTTAINLKAAINTPQYGVLKGTEVTTLYRGDRLALKDAGTLTVLKDVTVTVLLSPV